MTGGKDVMVLMGGVSCEREVSLVSGKAVSAALAKAGYKVTDFDLGRDIAALSAELGWQAHTTRAALSRLRKAGYAIEKLAPGKHGGPRYRLSSPPAWLAQ